MKITGGIGMLCIYRELIKSFTGFMHFDGWMIAKAEFKIKKRQKKCGEKQQADIKSEIIKQRRNYSVIKAGLSCENMEYMVVMHLLKPGETGFIQGGFKQEPRYLQAYCQDTGYMFSLEYSKYCIKEFTDCTGDSNYIHKVENPVVPGFLMFEDALERGFYVDNNYDSTESYTIIFKNPVFAGETINIYKANDSCINRIFAIPAEGHRYILWELERDNW